ncbi:hypothetical protein ABT294_46150 [Nonomuraea sp. NPDC000554]|uniref:hypothetical protein n=1 Tax=Nonomuraea sp. NPDC000554 TaxID=3154259 RepID=UPI00331D05C5
MNRLRKALVATSVGLAASAAFVAASSTSQADSLIVTYTCKNGVAGDAGVQLEAAVTPRLTSAGMLDVAWSIKYVGDRRFGSPGFFVKGSQLNLQGTVDITGAWDGQLRPKGGKEQGQLVPGDQLDVPEGLSDAGSVKRSGTIRVRPTGLVVRFTPAAGEVLVNNDKLEYTSAWKPNEHKAPEFGDHLYDLAETDQKDAVAKLGFTATKVEYISRRERDLGPVRVLIDGGTITDKLVEPGLDRNGTPMTGTKAQETLWSSPELAYKPHTIEVVNTENKKAYVDAIKVITGRITEPPLHDQATCTPDSPPGAIDVTVPGSTTPPASSPPPTSPRPTEPTKTATNTPTNNPSTTPPQHWDPGPTADRHVSVVATSTSTVTATATAKASSGPTSTKYVKAQVAKTPKGGVDTGEAAEAGNGSYGLIAGGSVLLMGSATGGLLLRRRRAAHAGGVS